MTLLPRLIRLTKVKLDEARQRIAQLEKRAAQYTRQIEDLDLEVLKEKKLAEEHPEILFALNDFLKSKRDHRQYLTRTLRFLEQDIERQKEELMEIFQETKRYEIAEEARREALKQELKQKEQNILDEIALSKYARPSK